jgi:hypothetical protein
LKKRAAHDIQRTAIVTIMKGMPNNEDWFEFFGKPQQSIYSCSAHFHNKQVRSNHQSEKVRKDRIKRSDPQSLYAGRSAKLLAELRFSSSKASL